MDVNGRAEFRETPGGPCVIEMNVTKKDVSNVLGGETHFVELLGHIGESRFRSGVEEHKTLTSLEGGRRNDAPPAELSCIENMDVHCP